MSSVHAVGEDALEVDRTLEHVAPSALVTLLRANPAIRDVVVTTKHVLVVPHAGRRAAAESALASCEALAAAAPSPTPRAVQVPVVYDGDDLAEVAARTGLSTSAVVDAHVAGTYRVAMLGFLPGFAYLEGLDARLRLPRKDVPRPRVPARSVAMAAGYTGIYPHASPGGWWLLGRAPGFHALGSEGATLAFGDEVRFVPTTSAPSEAADPVEATRAPVTGPRLAVTRIAGPALVVDGGRPGHLHEGIPASGPLVASALARANHAAGNASSIAGLEVYGALEVTARDGRVVLGDDDGTRHVLEDGATLVLKPLPEVRARYLAVAGGLDLPEALGSRSTLLVAGLGGLGGRPLRRDDVLGVGRAAPVEAELLEPRRDGRDAPLRLVPGPEADDATLELLARSTYVVSAQSDRTGTRLEGPCAASPPRDDQAVSRPMIFGVLERTPSGLVVLGPDHPTTGGYPRVAVLAAADRDAFFAVPVGGKVRFTF